LVGVLLVVVKVVRSRAVHHDGGLGLGGLCLLAALGSLLLLHLFVTHSGESTADLLDLVTGQLLGELLGELLQEQTVVGLLGRRGDDGGENVAELLKLVLGLRVEQRQVGQVDSVVGIGVVESDGRAGNVTLAAAADANATEEVLGVSKISILLGAAETRALVGLGLVVVLRLVKLGAEAGVLGSAFLDALGSGLLVSSSLGVSLGLGRGGLGGLLRLFALYLGILGGIPRVEDIAVIFFVAKLATAADGAGGWRGGRSAGIRFLFVCLKERSVMLQATGVWIVEGRHGAY
jgi:hypothetical protein